jgi:hypothetical protein
VSLNLKKWVDDRANSVRDIFDANTKADQQRRLKQQQSQWLAPLKPVTKNSPTVRSYKAEQKAQGRTAITNPVRKVATEIVKPAAQFVNTGNLALRQSLEALRMSNAMITGNPEASLAASKRADINYDRFATPNSGLLGQGAFISDPTMAKKGAFKDIAPRVVGGTIAAGATILPVTRGGSVAVRGIAAKSAVPKLAAEGASYSAAGSVGTQLATTGRVDPVQVAKDTVLNAALGPAAYGAGRVVKATPKVALKTNEAVNRNLTPRVNLQDQAILRDFSDMHAGAYKALPTDRAQLIQQARQIGTKYGVNLTNGHPADLVERTNSVLDQIGNSNKQVLEGGYVNAPTLPKVRAKVQKPMSQNVERVPLEVTNKDTLRGQFQTAITDKEAPIINYLKELDKQDGGQRTQQFYYDTGLQRRSNAIANAHLQNSDDLKSAIGGLKGGAKDEFDLYAAARNELSNAERGLPTSRSVPELKQTVAELAPVHEERFGALNNFYKDWAKRRLDAGIIDQPTYERFIANPDYSHIQRDMSDLANPRGKGGNSYSLGTTSARQKRTGSQRDIQPADVTAFHYAQESQKEIQRNQTASNLIDVLLEQGHARLVKDTTRKNTLSRIVNGKTEVYEVPRDIKEIADNVSPYQLGLLARIVSAPQRLLRAGATGLSVPFTAANYVKDQASSAIMSKNALATHTPENIMSGLWNAAKDFGVGTDDALWQKFTEHLGDTTQYDFIRNAKNSKQLSREIRLGQGGRAINKGLHPIRTLEDLNQITEKATRFQNFKGIYNKVLEETGNEAEATRQATLAAWQNSVDFSRMGHVGQALNLLIPYFNAGVQGTRLLGRRATEAPGQTAMKTIGLIGLPLAGATLYNLSDEKRKAVYDNISDYEKQNNIIIVLPGAKQQKDGSYTGVIKVPLQPGLSSTVQPLRHGVESFAHSNQADMPKMAAEFFNAVTGPINTSSPAGAAGSLIPQAVKPLVQQVANKDFFTGKEVVPDYVNDATDEMGNKVKESDKAFDYTSGSARIIGNLLGVSPIRVEKFVKDTSGKIGQYSENAADNALALAGAIPRDQIGGVSAKEDIIRRFARAQGTENFQKSEGGKHFDDVKKATQGLNRNELAAYNAIHPSKSNFKGDSLGEKTPVDSSVKALTYMQYPRILEADKRVNDMQVKRGQPGDPFFTLDPKKQRTLLAIQSFGHAPGNTDALVLQKDNAEWLSKYYDERSIYFDKIKSKMNKGDQKKLNNGVAGLPDKPFADNNLQRKLDAVSAITDAAQKRQFYADNPDITDYFAKNESYNRAKRAWIGLEQFDQYPAPPENVQKLMDFYNKLPHHEGPGGKSPARSAWIKSHPNEWAAIGDQYDRIAEYNLLQDAKIAQYEGHDFTEKGQKAVASLGGGSSGGGSRGSHRSNYYASFSSRGGGGGRSSTANAGSEYKYAISRNAGGEVPSPKVTVKQGAAKPKAASRTASKPKVTMRKSRV